MDWKTWLLGASKSKTVKVNVILTTAILWISSKYSIPLTPAEAAAITSLLYGVVNLILRAVTNKSLPDKGLEIKLPSYTDTLVEKITEIVEGKQPTKEELAREVLKILVEKQKEVNLLKGV